ncbi:hypothetical protein EIP86_003491 [Pleurotus ostreatoroseus]|nr:hypothetical protein EIP86_003491 [Pleurotus ostreatoroseus]
MFFSYMTPVVLAASRTSHLTLDQLPPLADVDHMKNLERRSFTRYIFWSLLHVFMWEHVYLLFLLLAFVIATLASPFAMNRILSYLEADGEGAVVHPWAWILMILIAPMTETVLAERYMWLVGRLLTQVQGILTQVIFDHALRIRVKTSAGDGSVQDTADISDSQSTIQGNESVTAVDETEPHQELQSETDRASTVSAQSSGSKKAANPAADSKENNLVGKLNNLVTTDINALEGGTTFILVGESLDSGASCSRLITG